MQPKRANLWAAGRTRLHPSFLPRQLLQTFPLPGEGVCLIRSRPFDPSPRPWHRFSSSPVLVETWPCRESSSFLSAAFFYFFPFPSPKRALTKRKQHIHPGNKSTINARRLYFKRHLHHGCCCCFDKLGMRGEVRGCSPCASALGCLVLGGNGEPLGGGHPSPVAFPCARVLLLGSY